MPLRAFVCASAYICAAVRPLTVTCVIDRPRERVFDYLADIANHAEFTDHFMREFRLERLPSRGRGAAARFKITAGPFSIWTDEVLMELEPPYRIVAEGRGGRLNRVPVRFEYRLIPHDTDMTRVELTFSTHPATAIDRLREALGARSWLKQRWARALRRMRVVLEEGEPSAHAARPAAG